MKKSLLAAIVMASFASAASAQSSVVIYGNLDVGVASVSGASASTHVPTAAVPAYSGARETKVRDGIMQGSRIGFRGNEVLSTGLSAVYTLEAGILADTGASDQGGVLFGRQAYVGLASDTAGSLTIGRQYAPYYMAFKSFDPMDDGLAGTSVNLFTTYGKRINNSLKYEMPSKGVSGFNGELMYGMGEVAGSNTASRTLSGALSYKIEKLMVKGAYHTLNNATASDKARSAIIGATYDFDAAKAYASYGTSKGNGTIDTRDLMLGVAVPMGAHKVMASYIRKDDRASSNRDASQVALAYTYSLSKRTALYTSAAKINNKNGATYRTASATAPLATQTGAVGGTREVNVGVRHLF